MERTQNLDPGKYWLKPVRSWVGDDTQLSSRKELDFPEISLCTGLLLPGNILDSRACLGVAITTSCVLYRDSPTKRGHRSEEL